MFGISEMYLKNGGTAAQVNHKVLILLLQENDEQDSHSNQTSGI